MIITTMTNWLETNVFQIAVLAELLSIVVALLLAHLISQRVRQYLEMTINNAADSGQINLNPDRFCTILKHAITLLLLWLFYIVLKRNAMPAEIGRPVFYFVFALMIYRFSSWYIRSSFWSRFVFIACLLFIALNAIGSWIAALDLLDSVSIKIGHVNISILSIARTVTTLLFLWSVAFMLDHFFSFLLASSTSLNYSDGRHLGRVIKFTLIVIVALITMAAAGIHPAALTVFGGAAGFAVGVGLQKIGSNVVSGIALMLRKPINQGDVLLMTEGSANTPKPLVVKEIGLIYIHLYSRDGTVELIPNESFVTQKIVNASLPIKPIRISIPFSVSYSSDLQKVRALALEAAQCVDRILPTPEPVCQLKELGDSAVDLELRVWINDPENGLSNVKSSVLLAVWDTFHTNNIEFAFPQLDLHIKSGIS